MVIDDEPACRTCLKGHCCEQIQECADDDDCWCFYECYGATPDSIECSMACGIQNPGQVPGVGDLFECSSSECDESC
jgi:hypothetical protein